MELLYNSIQFPKKITSISEEDLDIIMQSRKTPLFHNQEQWVKRGDDDFDAPMGCYDGAKVCELLGSYLLNKVSNIVPKESVGLYRDGVWCFTRSFRSTNNVRGRGKLL